MSDSEITTHRILAVDDDPFNLRIVSHALQQAEYKVMTAGSGEEALPWPGMRDADRGNPAEDQLPHSRPGESRTLASAFQRPMPVLRDLSAKCGD